MKKTGAGPLKNLGRSIFILAVLFSVSLSGLATGSTAQTPPQNSAPAAEATAAIQGDKLRLANNAIEVDWRFQENGLVANSLTDRLTNRTISLSSNTFVITLQDGEILKSSEMRVTAPPRIEKLPPDPNASQLAARFGGWQIEVGLSDSANRLQVVWRAHFARWFHLRSPGSEAKRHRKRSPHQQRSAG